MMLKKLQDKENRAWLEFYNENVNRIYRYIYGRCNHDIALSEDITQKVFLTAIEKINTFSGSAHELPWWLIGIARIETMRTLSRPDKVMGKTVNIDFVNWKAQTEWNEEQPDEDSKYLLIDQALVGVPAGQRQALLLKYCSQMSIHDIALKMEKSAKAIESLLSRGRESFKKNYLKLLGGSHE